jgi:hypothetical protein
VSVLSDIESVLSECLLSYINITSMVFTLVSGTITKLLTEKFGFIAYQ